MFDHVTIRVADRAASRRFYDTVLAPLGYGLTHETAEYDEWRDFGLAQARRDRPATRNLHVAFVARSREDVDAFRRAGVGADPDGNSVEAVHGSRSGGGNAIDHLSLRVADVDVARRFWETVAPVLGLAVRSATAQRFHVSARDRSFTVLRDGRPRTENVHLAFPVPDDATVGAFHRAALAAGFRDNGPPGERPQYHPGYVGCDAYPVVCL